MDIGTLTDALRPWLRLGTWHTGHPADDERFYRALAAAFTRGGGSIPADELREAMSRLLAEHHPEKRGDYWSDAIDKFVRKAELIGDYESTVGHARASTSAGDDEAAREVADLLGHAERDAQLKAEIADLEERLAEKRAELDDLHRYDSAFRRDRTN